MSIIDRITATSATSHHMETARARAEAMKASEANRSIIMSPGRPRWTPRDYEKLAKEGYEQQSVSYACIRQTVENAAEIPIVLQRVHPDGETETITDHRALNLLSAPNPMMSDYDFRIEWGSYLLIAGNSYVHGPAAGELSMREGEPVELWPLRPDKTTVVEGKWDDPDGPIGGYEYKERGKEPLPAEEVWHTKLFHPTSFFYGMSPLEAAARGVDQRNAAGAWNAAMLQNFAAPPGIVNLKGNVSENSKENFRDAFKEHMAGVKNARKTLVTRASDGIDYIQLALTAMEMDWREGMNISGLDICMAFKVPPQIVGIPGSQTFANYEQARKALYAEAVVPLVVLYCKHLTRWLLPKYEEEISMGQGPGLRFWYDRSKVPALQDDQNELAKRVVSLFEKGVITQRQAVQMMGVDDDHAEDLYYFQLVKPQARGAQEAAKRMQEAKERFPARIQAIMNGAINRN